MSDITLQDKKNDSTPLGDYIHVPVLFRQTVAALFGVLEADLDDLPAQSGIFVDATFGRGGHARLALSKMALNARLIVFDKDPSAIAAARALQAEDGRITVVHDSFAKLNEHLARLGIDKVNGVMADLGVSSPQLDEAARGFSFNKAGSIDMRMNTQAGQTVAQWLQVVDEETLATVIYEYGEEHHSRRIARAIKAMPNYDSTLELAEVIKQAHPAWQKGKHPATKTFQALRIFINNELDDIKLFLEGSLECLEKDASLALISFHSLEDRLIKQFFNNHSRGRWEGDEKLPIPPKRQKYFDKPRRIAPSTDEIANNPRARSAYLRWAKRL